MLTLWAAPADLLLEKRQSRRIHAKRLFLAACVLAGYGIVLLIVLLANVDSAHAEGSVTEHLVRAHVWIAAAGIPLATVYLIPPHAA